MIDEFNFGEIDYKNFYNKYIIINKPCLIRNFLPENDKCFKLFKKFNNFKKFYIGNIPSYFMKTSCFNEFAESLKEKITFNEGIRAWKHNKGNITQWHYDGNGINIFNICISGRKRFYLSPPGSIPVLPLSNISLKTDIWDEQSVFVEIGVSDMLYLPPYWFHKVITLEDNTLTVNYAFYHNKNSLFATNRDIYLYTLHDYFNTNMCIINNICKVTHKKNIIHAFLLGFYEVMPVYLIFTIIFLFVFKRNKKYYSYLLYLLYGFSVYLNLNTFINDVTSGISKLLSIYLFVFILYIHILTKIL
jgi:hypothetical protein